MANFIKIFLPAILSFIIGILITPLATHFFFKYKMWRKVPRNENIPKDKVQEFSRVHDEKAEMSTPRTGGIIILMAVIVSSATTTTHSGYRAMLLETMTSMMIPRPALSRVSDVSSARIPLVAQPLPVRAPFLAMKASIPFFPRRRSPFLKTARR